MEKIEKNLNDLTPILPEVCGQKIEINEGFYETKNSKIISNVCMSAIKRDTIAPNILTFGPPGTGKSDTLTQVFTRIVDDLDLYDQYLIIKVPCSQIKEADEFYSQPYLTRNGSINYKANWIIQAAKGAEMGKYVFVIFEELESLNPRLQVGLNTLLDRVNAFISWPTGEIKSLKPYRHRLFFSATVNPPRAGTPSYEIIHSLYSRFSIKLEFDFNPIYCREILIKKFGEYSVHDDREFEPCNLCKIPILIDRLRQNILFKKIMPAYREAIEICNLVLEFGIEWNEAIILTIPGRSKEQKEIIIKESELFKEGN